MRYTMRKTVLVRGVRERSGSLYKITRSIERDQFSVQTAWCLVPPLLISHCDPHRKVAVLMLEQVLAPRIVYKRSVSKDVMLRQAPVKIQGGSPDKMPE